MINEKYAKKFCKDDISKIENYDKAMADTTQTWHCHHRNELTLDGEPAASKADLIRMDMYYNRPYFELIFLTHSEHIKLHHVGKTVSDDTKKKMSAAAKDRTISTEQRNKIAESLKGHSGYWADKHRSNETRDKIAAAVKAAWAKRKAKGGK